MHENSVSILRELSKAITSLDGDRDLDFPSGMTVDAALAVASALNSAAGAIEDLQSEVDRLKGVLGEVVGTLEGAPDDEGVRALYDFACSTLEVKP